jgi:hypothetical protein
VTCSVISCSFKKENKKKTRQKKMMYFNCKIEQIKTIQITAQGDERNNDIIIKNYMQSNKTNNNYIAALYMITNKLR